jgi:hypothetical protein
MNNPRYRLLKNRYIAPTSNAGAPSPISENSGTVDVEAVVVLVGVTVGVTTVIVGCAEAVATGVVGVAVATCFTTVFVGAGVAVGVGVVVTTAFTTVFVGAGVAVGVGVVVPIAAFIAASICACVTEPSILAD